MEEPGHRDAESLRPKKERKGTVNSRKDKQKWRRGILLSRKEGRERES